MVHVVTAGDESAPKDETAFAEPVDKKTAFAERVDKTLSSASDGNLPKHMRASKYRKTAVETTKNSAKKILSKAKSATHWKEDRHFKVVNPNFYVRPTSVLNTSIGRRLDACGALTPLIMLLLIIFILVYFFKPGPRILEVDGPNGVTYRHKRLGPGAHYSMIVIFMTGIFLVLHRSNRDVLARSGLSFESLVVVTSFIQIRVAEFYNYEAVFCRGGACNWQMHVEEIVTCLVYPIPMGLTVSACDSWTVSPRRKFVVLLFCFILGGLRYAEQWSESSREKPFWLDGKACFWIACGNPRNVYVAGHCQVLAFIAKSMKAYAFGAPFAFVRPEYCDPESKEKGLVPDRIKNWLRPSASAESYGSEQDVEPRSSEVEIVVQDVCIEAAENAPKEEVDDDFTEYLEHRAQFLVWRQQNGHKDPEEDIAPQSGDKRLPAFVHLDKEIVYV